jgi:hypothetical protein
VLIDLVEVEFLRAEAKERGYNIPGTEEHYNNAIKYSIFTWEVLQKQTYLSQPKVAYSTAVGGWKQKIGFQNGSLYTTVLLKLGQR